MTVRERTRIRTPMMVLMAFLGLLVVAAATPQVGSYELYEARLAGSNTRASPFSTFCTAVVAGPSGSKIAPPGRPMNVTVFYDGGGVKGKELEQLDAGMTVVSYEEARSGEFSPRGVHGSG